MKLSKKTKRILIIAAALLLIYFLYQKFVNGNGGAGGSDLYTLETGVTELTQDTAGAQENGTGETVESIAESDEETSDAAETHEAENSSEAEDTTAEAENSSKTESTKAETENSSKAESTTAEPESSSKAESTKAEEETSRASETTAESGITVKENGEYTDKEHVALYIHTYGKLPKNYISKKEAENLGWNGAGDTLWDVAKGKSIGGSNFGNYEGLLPKKNGRKYYECDIDFNGKKRGVKRIVYSNDGLVYYTEDHYESFELLYD